MRPSPPYRSWCWKLLAVGFVISIVEVVCLIAAGILCRKGWMAYNPTLSQTAFQEDFPARQSYYGWPQEAPSPAADLDWGNKPCVSCYGDSFTRGNPPRETYPHELAERLGCRVDNFGMGAYGSDQALMLFQTRVEAETSPTVILGHMTENILRNVNQYRNLLSPGEEFRFKPRFRLVDTKLQYVPSPVDVRTDFAAFRSDLRRSLPFDAFVDRPMPRFPYSLALLRWLLSDFHVQARLRGLPRYAEFYSPAHPSGALPLTAAILSEFSDLAKRHGKSALLLIIPTCQDFESAEKTGEWIDKPLVEALRARGHWVLQAGPQIRGRLAGRPFQSLYEEKCSGHFNADGYRLLALVVAEELAPTIKRPWSAPSANLGHLGASTAREE